VPHPQEFAMYFNGLKEEAEARLLLRHGDVATCEGIVRDKLAEVNAVLDGTEVDVCFLVAGQIVAYILNTDR
jgi:hypothetical protein